MRKPKQILISFLQTFKHINCQLFLFHFYLSTKLNSELIQTVKEDKIRDHVLLFVPKRFTINVTYFVVSMLQLCHFLE